MYTSPVTRMTSQLSQPSSSISARVVGKNGAIPNRFAQYGRYENSPRGAVIAQRLAHYGAFIAVRRRSKGRRWPYPWLSRLWPGRCEAQLPEPAVRSGSPEPRSAEAEAVPEASQRSAARTPVAQAPQVRGCQQQALRPGQVPTLPLEARLDRTSGTARPRREPALPVARPS